MINGKEITFNKEEVEIWEKAFGFLEERINETGCIHCHKKYDSKRKITFSCLYSGKLIWWHKQNCLLYKYSPTSRNKRKEKIFEYVKKLLDSKGYISNKKFTKKFGSNSLKDVVYQLRNNHYTIETVVITNKDTLYVTPQFLTKMMPNTL